MMPSQSRASGLALMVGGIVLAAIMVVAYVYLRAIHEDPSPLVIILAPIVAALLIGGQVQNVTAGQNLVLDQHGQTLAKISQQTNGILDQRIKEGVTAALAEHIVTNGSVQIPAPASPSSPAAVAPVAVPGPVAPVAVPPIPSD